MMLSLSLKMTARADGEFCLAGDPCKQIKADCQDIVTKIAVERADRDKLESDQGKVIQDQNTQIAVVSADRDQVETDLGKWYHNPLFLVPISIVVGGIGALYLEHR